MLKSLLVLIPLLMTSCVDFPNQFAPSRARRPDTGPDPRGLKQWIEMKDATSLSHLAWGFNPAAFDGEKRKAEPKAALRFLVTDPASQKFSIDVLSPQSQLIRFKVNTRLAGEITAKGAAHFEANVEPSDFVPGTATLVEIESDAGLSVFRAGFIRR
jgi:hypothetical protein